MVTILDWRINTHDIRLAQRVMPIEIHNDKKKVFQRDYFFSTIKRMRLSSLEVAQIFARKNNRNKIRRAKRLIPIPGILQRSWYLRSWASMDLPHLNIILVF